MILLDTNILSELMRIKPDPGLIFWLDQLTKDQIWVSAITQAEIRLGFSLLPDGKRKSGLREATEAMFQEDFNHRCLPFDSHAATHYADIVTERRSIGRPISVEDAQIAAIARSNALAIATRNTKDFSHITGLNVIDPWDPISLKQTPLP